MIIRGGYNVYPREVEEVLYAHPGVLEAAVFGIRRAPRRGGGCVRRARAEEDRRGRGEGVVAERVAAYKYPRHVVVIDELPKSPTGKILKRRSM